MRAQFDARPALVVAILSYEQRLRGSVEQFKAVVQLADGSYLHINEVWIGGELRKYAYYQVTPADQVIRGWDNAPHHPEVSTHPHHLHLHHTGVQASEVHSLADVLNVLETECANG